MVSTCRRSAVIGLLSLFLLASVLVFVPSSTSASFHEVKKNIAGTAAKVSPSPKAKGSGSPFLKFFRRQSKPTQAKPTPSPKTTSAKPAKTASVSFSLGNFVSSALDFFGFDGKEQDKPAPKVAAAQPKVKGAADQKGGNFLSGFFKSVGNVLASIGDALWPFDGDKKLAKDKGKTAASKSPAPSAAPGPTELAKTGDEVPVATASDTGSVTVAVPNTITNDNLTILGNLTWGDSTADRLILKGLLDSDLLLSKSKTYTLGNSGERFKAGYFSDNVYIGDENRIGATGMNTKGSMYLETRSDGSIYLNADSKNVYVGNSGNLEVAGNVVVKGTLSTPSGAGSTLDSVDITPATNIDALDIIGTNITTASLIDLDPTGTTSGNIIDIDTSTAHTGHVISVDNTGNAVWTGNVIDVDTGTGDASGDVINIAIEAGATDVQGLVVTNAAATDQAGWLMAVNASAAWTANAINFIQSAGIATADVIAYDNTGNTATTSTADFISFASGTGDADGDVMDITVELGATSTQIFDVNNAALSDEAGWLMEVDTTGAWTGNAIDFTTGANAWTGNVLDINFGNAAATGDVVNIDIPALAVGVQNLVVTNAAASSTAGWLASVAASGAWTANAINFDQTGGISTADVLAYDNSGNTATTGDFISFASGTGDADGDIMDVTVELGATSTQIFDVNNAAVSDEAGWLLEVDTTGAWTGNMIDVALGAQASTGDIVNVSMGSTNIAGGVLVVADAGGARTDALIDITTASTGSAADAAAIFQINSTGDLDDLANVFDINMSGGTGANAIDITTLTTASSGNLIDLTFGNIADTGDAINISHGASAVGVQAMVVALNSGGLTNTAGIFDIDLTAGNAAVDGINLSFTANDAITADTDMEAMVITLTANDVDADMFGLRITNAATAAVVGADDTECLICLDNAENTASVLSDAIRITNSGATDAAILTGIDFDTTGIVTDIELQNAETIANDTDDSIVLTGAGGTNNETFTIDLDSVASSGTTLSSGGTFVLVNDNLSVGIDGNTTENIASSDFAFSGNDLYVDDKVGINGVLSVDGNFWQGDAVTTTTKTTAFLFLGTTAGAPTGDPATPAGFAAIVWDTTNNKICADEEAAGGTWLCTAALTDIAEWMPAAGAQSGDLVSVTNLPNPTEDPTAPFMLGKTTKAYDNKLVGVISKYAEEAQAAQGYKLSEDYHAVTLVGRVPVKVTGEGGPIAKGDYLTSSSTPGHAMRATKAGPVVGMALEPFSGDTGTIMIFVKAAYWDPIAAQKAAVLAALGLGSGSVLGASTQAVSDTGSETTSTGASSLVGPAADGSLGVLAEEVDLLVHGLLTANNLRVTTAAEFEGTLVVKGLATFEGNVIVKGELTIGSLDISGALTKTMTAGSDISAGDPVVVTGANTVARAGGPSANVVGLAAHSAGAGSAVKVAVAGTVGGYSGLATGARYYVGSGGVVTTAPGGDRAVHIGIAVSGSEMIVQIFEAAAPPAPPVVDTATVDTGLTVAVSDGTSSGGSSEGASSPTTPEASPTPTPEPVVEPTPEPSVAPEASPTPEPSPSPQP